MKKFLVFGAGALGTYIGGSLALGGYPVVFLEKPEVAEELHQRGLRLGLPRGEMQLDSPKIAGSIEAALASGPFDVGVFALKSFDTHTAIEQLSPYSNDLPPLLCLQNGVDNEAMLANAFGPDGVIAGTVTSAVSRRQAGDIVLERLRGVGITAGHRQSTGLIEAFNRAGLNARLYSNADEMKWSKMLTNLLANATSAILDMSPADIFSHPGLYRLEVGQLREALNVMRSKKLRPVNLPSTPVRLLAISASLLPPGLSRPFMQRAVGGGRGAKMPSFYIDLHSGRGQSEVDFLNGAVVRHGAELSIPTPINRLLTETLLALSSGALPGDTYSRQPDKLLSLLPQFM